MREKIIALLVCAACILSVVFVAGCTSTASPINSSNESVNQTLQDIAANQRVTNSLLTFGIVMGMMHWATSDDEG